MTKTKKKKYEKPQVRRVSLDGKTSVLGFCKTGVSGPRGPNHATCKTMGVSPCQAFGS